MLAKLLQTKTCYSPSRLLWATSVVPTEQLHEANRTVVAAWTCWTSSTDLSPVCGLSDPWALEKQGGFLMRVTNLKSSSYPVVHWWQVFLVEMSVLYECVQGWKTHRRFSHSLDPEIKHVLWLYHQTWCFISTAGLCWSFTKKTPTCRARKLKTSYFLSHVNKLANYNFSHFRVLTKMPHYCFSWVCLFLCNSVQ